MHVVDKLYLEVTIPWFTVGDPQYTASRSKRSTPEAAAGLGFTHKYLLSRP